MRREYIQSEEPVHPVIPFEENLIFYAPLTQGDLTDHISGNTLTIRNGETIVYDSDKQMYKFFCQNVQGDRYTKYGWYNLSLGIINNTPSSSNLHYTVTFDFLNESCEDWSRFIPAASYVQTQNYYTYCGFIDNVSFVNQLSGTHKLTLVINGSSTLLYKDGSYIQTTSTVFDRRQLSASYFDDRFCVYYCYGARGGSHSGSGWMRDVRVYNRVLSASEVAQL